MTKPANTKPSLKASSRKAVASKSATNPESGWFGYREVSPAEKTQNVIGVFDSVAGNYDLMNDLMSFGVHRLWKRNFISHIAPKPGMKCLDVAGGTGDIAFGLLKKTDGGADVTVFDLNHEMLKVGRSRAVDKGWLAGKNCKLQWQQGNAEVLPFANRSFDLYTIAFGLRNVTYIDTALREAARVLKPGGRFFCLEFAPVEKKPLKNFYDVYSFTLLPWLGERVAGDRDSYQYLAESIRQFPKPDDLKKRLEKAGFIAVKHTALTGGIAIIHEAIRL